MKRFLIATLFAAIGFCAQADVLKLAVTTSFNNSGLSDVLLPQITADTGLEVQLLIAGTGQALTLGQAGDVDAILVHSKVAENAFVVAGFGTYRREIMFNDFVLIGPAADPVWVKDEATSAADALRRIAAFEVPLVNRGDDSGTHKKERALWQSAGLNPTTFGGWYKELGSGMGAALNTAAGLDTYILADRASWLNFAYPQGLEMLFSGDPVLFNQYAYVPVNPARHAHVNDAGAVQLEAWLTGETAKALINSHRINGQTLFTINAR